MSTSRLQKEVGSLLRKYLPGYEVQENTRPEWLLSSELTRLELDYYIDQLKIAFEIQGLQHFVYIPYFHASYADFEKRLKYDTEKRDLCFGAGIKLIEIVSLFDAEIEIKNIAETLLDFLPDLNSPFVVGTARSYVVKKRPVKTNYYKTLDTISKYKFDLDKLLKNGDPVATPTQKSAEIKQFNRKLRKCEGKLMHFGFKYLGYADIVKLLDTNLS